MSAAAIPPERPWRLVRRGHAPLGFASRGTAQWFYDRLRFNAGADAGALLEGPGGERWRCGRFRGDRWVCDQPGDADRRPETAAPWWIER